MLQNFTVGNTHTTHPTAAHNGGQEGPTSRHLDLVLWSSVDSSDVHRLSQILTFSIHFSIHLLSDLSVSQVRPSEPGNQSVPSRPTSPQAFPESTGSLLGTANSLTCLSMTGIEVSGKHSADDFLGPSEFQNATEAHAWRHPSPD